jgi:hypothetical protein
MAGQVAKGDLLVLEGRDLGRGRQVTAKRNIQTHQALLGQVGQQ